MSYNKNNPDSELSFESLIQRLRGHALTQPDKIIYTFIHSAEMNKEELNFSELQSRVDATACKLLKYCEPGDRALIIFNPGFNFIISFLACLSVGVIAVPLYPSANKSTKKDLIKHVISDCNPDCIMTGYDVNDFQTGKEVDIEIHCPILFVDSTIKIPYENKINDKYTVKPDDIAFLQYTSGTTGKPKGVMVSHRNLVTTQQQLQKISGHTKQSSGVSWLPPYHDMGLIGGILQPLYVGFPVVLMAPTTFVTKPIKWLETISSYKATTSCAPNFAYDLCVKRINKEQSLNLDLSSLSVVFNGAEPISAHVINSFSEHFHSAGFNKKAFLPCYGLAEATLIVSGCTKVSAIDVDSDSLMQNIIQSCETNSPTTSLVSCGYPAAGVEIAIVDANTLENLPDNNINEIWVKGSNIASGYWNKSELSKAVFSNTISGDEGKWLRTGDLGFIRDKQLYISGRMKDLIIIRGKNYYPQDIENIVAQQFSSLRKNCIAAFSVYVGNHSNQEQLALVCELERDSIKHIDYEKYCLEINAHISKILEIQTSHIALIKPASIPKTTSGKIRRFECRDLLLKNKLSLVYQWERPTLKNSEQVVSKIIHTGICTNNNQNDLKEWMLCHVTNLLGSNVSESIQFDDMGIDSLGKATFLGELSDYIGYEVPIDILNDYKTIADLSRYLTSINEIRNGLSKLDPLEKNRTLNMLSSAKERNDLFDISNVPIEYYNFDSYQPNINLINRNKLISTLRCNPFFASVDCVNNNYITKNGERFINYSSNDFLGMSDRIEVQQEAIKNVRIFGSGVSASRLISGEKQIHADLESKISNLINTEDALVFVGAATTNVSVIGHLFNENDLILYDELSHDSLLQGIRLSHAAARPFKHNDVNALEKLLEGLRCKYEKVLIFVEGLYSMDGDTPVLQEFIDCKKKYKCWLMVDECLSIGVLGNTGRGISEEQLINVDDIDIWMGGLSKAFGSCGGYIAGKRELINYLKYTCPGFIFTTGISPANTGAASKAISLMMEDPAPVIRLRENAQLFLRLAKEEGLNTGSCQGYSIVPIIIGSTQSCLTVYEELIQDGINVHPVLYPAVAENSSRFRFSLTASHTEEQIRYTVSCVAKRVKRLTGRTTMCEVIL